MTAPPAFEQERALKQMLRLVDLSCDLERNQDDGNFARDRGKIFYVLDENVFEMFVQPFRHQKAVETFYADIWSLSGGAEESWRSFEAQAALITSEYIVSGTLPGAETDSIAMTEQHRWELADRVATLAEALQREVGERSDLHKDVRAKFEVISVLIRARDGTVRIDDEAHPLLKEDLTRLAHLDRALIPRIYAARVAAAFLAVDQVVEPLDQLRRVASNPIRGRLRTLQAQFQPAQRRDLITIEADAERWFRRFVRELKQPGHSDRNRAKEANQGRNLWNDARSVAYLRWVARTQLGKDSRLAFVTGDPVLFDAYRRWYFELGEEARDKPRDNPNRAPSPGEPFFMRRAVQFSPIFNPFHSGGDLTKVERADTDEPALFSRIEQAVEAVLLAVPPIEAQDQRIESISGRHREWLALKQVDRFTLLDDPELAGLATGLSEDWIHRSMGALRTIRKLWQETQRLAIGGSYDLISLRLSDELREAAERYGLDPGPATLQVLNDYVANVLDQLVESTIQLWRPLAETINAKGYEDPTWLRPAIKRLSMATAIPADPELKNRAEVLFSRATLKALDLQDVKKANRFASIAARADELARLDGSAIEAFDFELKYLNAVTHRMLINAVDAHLLGGGSDVEVNQETKRSAARAIEQVKNSFERASTLLQECLAWHHSHVETSYEHAVRYLRALSERASLHLFISTSLGLRHKSYSGMAPSDAERYLIIALGDLRRCIEFDRTLDRPHDVLDAVRNQFIPNIAGYEVLSFLLAGPEDYKPNEWRRAAVNQLWTFWQTQTDLHPLLTAELFATAALLDRPPPRGKRFRPENRKRDLQLMRLPLDRALLRAIYRKILNDPGTAPDRHPPRRSQRGSSA